jgi:hypothetical protein
MKCNRCFKEEGVQWVGKLWLCARCLIFVNIQELKPEEKEE